MEQAVIVHLRLCDAGFGTLEERKALLILQDQMHEAIVKNSVGVFDGDELGQGECVIFMYGPDANLLYDAIEPLLKSNPVASDGFAIKRYGKADDASVLNDRVTW